MRYQTGKPPAEGIYACQVPIGLGGGWFDDRFLTWRDGRWTYTGSDQQYRGDDVRWIGPLPRR